MTPVWRIDCDEMTMRRVDRRHNLTSWQVDCMMSWPCDELTGILIHVNYTNSKLVTWPWKRNGQLVTENRCDELTGFPYFNGIFSRVHWFSGLTKTSRDAGTHWPTNWAVHNTLDAKPAAGTMGPLRNWPSVAPSAPSRQPIPDCLLNVLLLFKWSLKLWFIS